MNVQCQTIMIWTVISLWLVEQILTVPWALVFLTKYANEGNARSDDICWTKKNQVFHLSKSSIVSKAAITPVRLQGWDWWWTRSKRSSLRLRTCHRNLMEIHKQEFFSYIHLFISNTMAWGNLVIECIREPREVSVIDFRRCTLCNIMVTEESTLIYSLFSVMLRKGFKYYNACAMSTLCIPQVLHSYGSTSLIRFSLLLRVLYGLLHSWLDTVRMQYACLL
jgi:hypothetical protein